MPLSPSSPHDGSALNPVRAVLALITATFVISASFGLNMPLLPPLIEAVTAGRRSISVPLHAGLLAAVFTLALGAFAPAWGAWSDRVGRRQVLLIGMGGFALTMAAFAAPSSLAALYAEQLLSGMSAAAVLPVASALVADLAPDDHWRASRLAWLNMALVAGFVLGPVVGSQTPHLLIDGWAGRPVLVTPFLAAAALALPALGMLWRWTPRGDVERRRSREVQGDSDRVRVLLALTFVVSLAIGIFEVAIAIRGGRTLGLSAVRVAALFTSCSLIMFGAQAAVFSPVVQPRTTARLVAPAFAVMALGLAGAATAGSFAPYVGAVTLFAGSGGVLVPVLAYWVSRHAGRAQGAQLGRQTAAAGLGQAAGSALAGLMFGAAASSSAALWVGAAVASAAALASAGLLAGLETRASGDPGADVAARLGNDAGRR
jgi:predicted MFS family arabinose efflux permease